MYDLSDIFQSLRADHHQISRLLRQIVADTEGSKRRSCFAQVRHELKIHSAAEEEALYSRLRGLHETKALAERATEEHDEVDRLIEQLEARPAESADWVRIFEELKDNFDQHSDEEEGKVFSEMRRVFKASELREIGIRFQEAKEKLHTELSRAA